MNENIVEQFRQKHESLAGIVHLVSGMEEAAEKVKTILQEKGTEKAAFANLLQLLGQMILYFTVHGLGSFLNTLQCKWFITSNFSSL